KGYKMILIMPEHMSEERRAVMKVFGAEIILTPEEGSMEAAIDLSREMEADKKGIVLDQFSNQDNPLSHYEGTGPEIWRDTHGKITHFVSSMGTTGTIMGTSRYLKEQNPEIQIVGVQPIEGAQIPGIRRWPKEYLPKIYDETRVDRIIDVEQGEAEETTIALGREEGIFAGISSGGAIAAALKLSAELENALIVTIVCDRGDRYLSTDVFKSLV
ncbi:MAG: cysteine synthase B, partial [Gammaproteobacteria bacterium]